MGWPVSGVVGYFLRLHLILPAVVLMVLAVGATWVLRNRFGGPARRVVFLLWSWSVGLVVLVTLLREPQLVFCPSCVGGWVGVDKILAGAVGADGWLNVVLFVLPALLATVLWRAPWRTAGVAVVVSLAVEVVQPILGVGVSDWMDVLANAGGALIGVGAGSVVLLVWDAVADRRLDLARTVKLAVSLLVGAGILIGWPVWVADQRQALGVTLMENAFADTTLADYQVNRATTWEAEFAAFWEATGRPTMSSWADDTVARQRATWHVYFVVRCVVGEWTPSGFAAVTLGGEACTAPLQLED